MSRTPPLRLNLLHAKPKFIIAVPFLCTDLRDGLLQIETTSCFQLDQFNSLLLPDNNRPLESSVLLAVKGLFSRSHPNTLALHMLSVDCQVASGTSPCAAFHGTGWGLNF